MFLYKNIIKVLFILPPNVALNSAIKNLANTMQTRNLHFRERAKIREDEGLRVTGREWPAIFRPLREIHAVEVT